MDENEGLACKERSLGDLMGHFTSDIQGGQYNYMRFQQNRMQPPQRMGHGYPNENIDPAIRSQRNILFPESYQSNSGGHFILNSGNDILPTMIDVGGGNYVVYGSPNAQMNQNIQNMHFIKKTNGTLTRFNDYGMEYPGNDYNLMRGLSPQTHSGAQYPQHNTETNCKAQLIENLVGNWASDQSGTYSPFGSSLGGIRTLDSESIGNETGTKRPRIVAEVRPMRPSYSDVLSKSIITNPKTNKNCQNIKQKTSDVKVKSPKSVIGRTLSGNGNILNRQHSAGADESTLSNINSSLKKTVYKKQEIGNEENLSKKWVSLDDLKETTRQEEYISLNEVKNRKNSPKTTCNKGNKKEKWESVQLNNTKNVNEKVNVPKKQEKTKHQPAGAKREEPPVKVETTKEKNCVNEERRGPSNNQGKSEQQKSSSSSSRRSVRTCQVEKPRKTQKSKRKEQEPCISLIVKQRVEVYGGILLRAVKWFLQLVMDVLGLSTHLAIHMCVTILASTKTYSANLYKKLSHSIRNVDFFQRLFNAPFGRFKNGDSKKNKSKSEDDSDDTGEAKVRRKMPRGLKHNISLPVTGEEAMKRLLACKGKDPYSILGVTQDCTDDDIKKYYKRQAFLVHPDKNNQPGAEEAFKILVHAFNLIGKPEVRKMYDHKVEKTQVEQAAWTELNDLLSQLHKKMEYVANTIRCTNCNKRHKRRIVDRPIYAARVCAQCKIHHSVREGDIWAETSFFGLIWRYYACMDGAVYDITEWAGCQGSNLRNLKANTHNVQYRIVLGKQQGNRQRYQHAAPTSEPDIEEFLNNFYTKTDSGMAGADADQSAASGRKRKSKGKK
ncbi:UNVERIFIED_CONTAM: hypothetical protein PYX00_004331 [Menopon gallinae]|uniref:J domain-containing protein n=1 Tax=Menopon gallinae TaxID=328185 RepID=A0AAW2I3R3_9NEOP